ncbi:MAG: DciA family protein [Rhodoferax sp.]
MTQNRRNHAVTLQQATQDSPTLARLSALALESAARLQSVQSLLPAALRAAVRPGPIEGTVWCLVLDNSSVAAKIRQLLPAMESHLRSKGWEVTAIRLKVQTSGAAR